MTTQAVLLLNLGSPDSCSIPDVKRYLKEFLSDERVLDAPYLIRQFILNCLILPFRPKRSAHAYSKVWTDKGSPLIYMSQRQQSLLQEHFSIPIELAMCYGNPSISEAIKRLKNIKKLFIMPLYPHYAMSSYETVVVKAMECIQSICPDIQTTLLQPFYKEPDYIEALVATAKPYLSEDFDQLLFTFHGLPERHLRKSDCSHSHCLKQKNCCQTAHPTHSTCYRHQCFQTVEHFVNLAQLKKEQYSVSFQSRLLRDPWLQPFTDNTIERFAKEGMKKLLVISPSFVSDCLETIEEIGMSGSESFIKNGGQNLKLIPCLNDHPLFIQFLANRIHKWITCVNS